MTANEIHEEGERRIKELSEAWRQFDELLFESLSLFGPPPWSPGKPNQPRKRPQRVRSVVAEELEVAKKRFRTAIQQASEILPEVERFVPPRELLEDA